MHTDPQEGGTSPNLAFSFALLRKQFLLFENSLTFSPQISHPSSPLSTPALSRSIMWSTYIILNFLGNSPAIQWLGLHAFTAEGTGSIPGGGTEIAQAVHRSQKKQNSLKVPKMFFEKKHSISCILKSQKNLGSNFKDMMNSPIISKLLFQHSNQYLKVIMR